MKLGSLFSGIGGFELGMERSGFEVAWQAECDKQARSVLAKHWPDVYRYKDVCDVRNAEPVDVICGGFPCQDYSVAGGRDGLAGDRGALWWEMHRIIADQRPTWVVGENVPGMLSSRGGRDFLEIVRSLVQLGYGVTWATLDSQYFGVPQRRRRLFVVGHSGGIPRPEILAIAEGLHGHPAPRRKKGSKVAPTVTGGAPFNRTGNERVEVDALVMADAHAKAEIGSDISPTSKARSYKDPPIAFDMAQMTSAHNRSNPQPGDPCHTLHQNEPPSIAFHYTSVHHMGAGQPGVGPTLKVGSGIGMTGTASVAEAHKAPRRLTPLECERLQGFPDEWTKLRHDDSLVADGPRYKMLGNAVTVNVAEWIGRQLCVLKKR